MVLDIKYLRYVLEKKKSNNILDILGLKNKCFFFHVSIFITGNNVKTRHTYI